MSVSLSIAIFQAIEKGLTIWDHYNKTSYQRKYAGLIREIQLEEAKPVYDENLPDRLLRDQNRIDRANHELKLLLNQFIGEKNDYKNHKT